jgi:hypothetical protein
MPANIVLRDLTNPPKKGNTSPIIATRADLRDGSRGSFGNTPLSWTAIDGNLNHGSRIRLTSNIVDRFGARYTPHPRQFSYGSNVRVGGVAAARAETVEAGPSPDAWGNTDVTRVEVITDDLPDAVIDQMYAGIGQGTLVGLLGMSNVPAAQGDKLYMRYVVKDSSDFMTTYMCYYNPASKSGTFQTNAPRWVRGEAVTVTRPSASALTGWICRDDAENNVLTIDVQGGLGAEGTASLDGATVTGQVSGATAVIDNTNGSPAGLGATKVARIKQEDSSSNGNSSVLITPSRINNGSVDVDYGDGATIIHDSGNTDFNGISSPSKFPTEFTVYELEADFSGEGSTGRVTVRINNVEVLNVETLDTSYLSPERGFKLDNLGMDTPGIGNFSHDVVGASCVFGQVFADNDTYRVYLGDAATLDECTTPPVPLYSSQWESQEAVVELYGNGQDKYLILVGPRFTTIDSVQLRG